MRLQTILKWLLIYSGSFLFLCGCGASTELESSRIRISGSDTMLPLNKAWAKAFAQDRPDIKIVVEGGGSSVGIRKLIEGKVDIATASRNISPEEVRLVADKYQSIGLALKVAKDHLSVFIHPDNPTRNIRLDDLKKIFAGEIQNWKEMGGNDQAILVFRRPDNAGSARFFQNRVLEESPFSPNSTICETTDELIEKIAMSPNGIGFGGTAFGGDSRVRQVQINGLLPQNDPEDIDLYPLSRFLYYFTIRPPQGLVKEYLNFVTSPIGQKIVSQIGYFPLW